MGRGDCVYIHAYVGRESLRFLDLSMLLFMRASGSKSQHWNCLPSSIMRAGLMLWAGSSFFFYKWLCGWLRGCDLRWKPSLAFVFLSGFTHTQPTHPCKKMVPFLLLLFATYWESLPSWFNLSNCESWDWNKTKKLHLSVWCWLSNWLEGSWGLDRKYVLPSWEDNFSFFLIENFWLRQKGQENLLKGKKNQSISCGYSNGKQNRFLSFV